MSLNDKGREILKRLAEEAREVKRKVTEYPVTEPPPLSVEELMRFEEAKKDFSELEIYCKIFNIDLLEGQTHYGPVKTRCTIPTKQLLKLFKMLEK